MKGVKSIVVYFGITYKNNIKIIYIVFISPLPLPSGTEKAKMEFTIKSLLVPIAIGDPSTTEFERSWAL